MSTSTLLDEYRNNFNKREESFLKEGLACGIPESELKKDAKISVKPGSIVGSIETVDLKKFRDTSPQLAERFSYAGSWYDIGEHLLGADEISTLLRKRKFRTWLKSMRENWENSAPWLYPDESLSVISSTNEDDGGFTLLVWTGNAEPEVWRYSGQSEHKFKDLDQWITWLNEE